MTEDSQLDYIFKGHGHSICIQIDTTRSYLKKNRQIKDKIIREKATAVPLRHTTGDSLGEI